MTLEAAQPRCYVNVSGFSLFCFAAEHQVTTLVSYLSLSINLIGRFCSLFFQIGCGDGQAGRVNPEAIRYHVVVPTSTWTMVDQYVVVHCKQKHDRFSMPTLSKNH